MRYVLRQNKHRRWLRMSINPCICGLEPGTNLNCGYCKAYAEEMSIGEVKSECIKD